MAFKLSLSLLFCVIFFILVVPNVDSASPHQAPSPSVDCSSLVLNMADCLTFVTNGSTVSKPEGSCCSGLKTVLKADSECLCEAFKSSAQLGVVLNVSKALSLPEACRVSAPSLSTCGLSLAPGAAPVQSPTSAAAAGAPTAVGAASEQAPAPAPGSSGSSMLAISAGSLVVSLVVASFSSF